VSPTLIDRIWQSHVVTSGVEDLLYIDLHLVHEVTSPQAFAGLKARGLKVRRPDRTICTLDHSLPTHDRALPVADPIAAEQLNTLRLNAKDHGLRLLEPGTGRQGIVHVVGPELGLTQPGMTIVCGDSHTATHGAFGALAFGIGTSEVELVLATQCLPQRRPKRIRVRFRGRPGRGTSAKDLILALLSRHGVGAGSGAVFEYTGEAIRSLSMEGRMTLCNMSIEAGAKAGLIAPDDTTFAYLAGRDLAPKGAAWDVALTRWRTLRSDDDARFDGELEVDAEGLAPQITFGTTPGMGCAIGDAVPDRPELERALAYMGLRPGQPIAGHPIQAVFLGSCTNGRLEDLREAASLLRGRKVAQGVRMLVVPGSERVKRDAETEGLHRIFLESGAEWREPGCSLCIAMNGDQLAPGETAVSTSNRNFEGRQGKGSRTLLASPLTAAASAVTGAVADPRPFLEA
jgi:3-isopropylmalate/(R)-2-methylmalate dehydratase large subunit